MLLRHSMLGLVAASLLVAGRDDDAFAVDRRIRLTPQPEPKEPHQVAAPRPTVTAYSRSKYMPHVGAKQRAKAAARLAKARGRIAETTEPGDGE